MMIIIKNKQKITIGFASYEVGLSNDVNNMPFSGVCAYVDRPTEGIPCGGSINKPVAFDGASILAALPKMVGQGINCCWPEDIELTDKTLSGHDRRFKIGTIDKAELRGDEVYIEGHFWDYDFEDVCKFIKTTKNSIGFSVDVLIGELADQGEYLLAKDIDLIGAALLFKDKAAFKTTYLAANDSGKSQLVSLFDEINKISQKRTCKYGKKDAVVSGREQFRKVIEKRLGDNEIEKLLDEKLGGRL